MKKLLFCLLLPVLSHGQTYCTFPDSNARWSVYYAQDNSGVGLYNAHTTLYFINGDTIIANNNYRKIYGTIDSVTIYSGYTTISPSSTFYVGGIREDSSKRIFFINGTNTGENCLLNTGTAELLLYQFGLNTGDTVITGVCDSFRICKQNIIGVIDSVLVGNEFRKRYQILNSLALGEEYWIEGIGSTKGLFFPYCEEFEWSWELLCYKENDSLLYQSNLGYCSIPLKINDNQNQVNNLNIFPNPLTQDSKLSFSNNTLKKVTIEVYNILGNKLTEISTTGNTVTLSNNNYLPGIYIVYIEDDKFSYLEKAKFIVR